MGKVELAEFMSREHGLTKKASKEIIDAFIASIEESLAEGKDVMIRGFGTFTVKKRAARTGLNPSTLEPIEIAAKNVVRFKPSKVLKDLVNGGE